MPIKCHCVSCAHPHEVADTLAGRRITCLQCGERFAVPRQGGGQPRHRGTPAAAAPVIPPAPVGWPEPHFVDPSRLRFHGPDPRTRTDSEQIWMFTFGQKRAAGRDVPDSFVGRLLLHPLLWDLSAAAPGGSQAAPARDPTPVAKCLGLESKMGIDAGIPAGLPDASSLVRWLLERRGFRLDPSARVDGGHTAPGHARCVCDVFRHDKGQLVCMFVSERKADARGDGVVEVEIHGIPKTFGDTNSPKTKPDKLKPPVLVPPKHAALLRSDQWRYLTGRDRHGRRHPRGVFRSGWAVTHNFGGHPPVVMGNLVDGLSGYGDVYPDGDPRQ